MPVTVKRRNARRSNVDVRNLWKKRCAGHMYTISELVNKMYR